MDCDHTECQCDKLAGFATDTIIITDPAIIPIAAISADYTKNAHILQFVIKPAVCTATNNEEHKSKLRRCKPIALILICGTNLRIYIIGKFTLFEDDVSALQKSIADLTGM